MTAQERAVEVMRTVYGSGWTPDSPLLLEIAAGIRAAVEAERERCARIAETWADPRVIANYPGEVGCIAAANEGLVCTACAGIAARIREG